MMQISSKSSTGLILDFFLLYPTGTVRLQTNDTTSPLADTTTRKRDHMTPPTTTISSTTAGMGSAIYLSEVNAFNTGILAAFINYQSVVYTHVKNVKPIILSE
jgi:hypothetical protein